MLYSGGWKIGLTGMEGGEMRSQSCSPPGNRDKNRLRNSKRQSAHGVLLSFCSFFAHRYQGEEEKPENVTTRRYAKWDAKGAKGSGKLSQR